MQDADIDVWGRTVDSKLTDCHIVAFSNALKNTVFAHCWFFVKFFLNTPYDIVAQATQQASALKCIITNVSE